MKNLKVFIIILGLLFYSCKNGEPYTSTYFFIKNNSGHNVKLTVFNAEIQHLGQHFDTTFILPNNHTIMNFFDFKGNDGNNYAKPFGNLADSAFITFDEIFRITYQSDDSKPRNILHTESYLGGKKNAELFEYTYTITEDDYNIAEK